MLPTIRRYHVTALGARWAALLLRACVLALGWWGLTRADPEGLAFGVVVVVLALLVSVWISPLSAPTWRVRGLLRLAYVFVVGSIGGGVQVARQALAPRLHLAPRLVSFRSRLRSERALDLMMSTLSLMPGAVCVERSGRELLIHVLLGSSDAIQRQLEQLEEVIASALGLSLAEPEPTHG